MEIFSVILKGHLVRTGETGGTGGTVVTVVTVLLVALRPIKRGQLTNQWIYLEPKVRAWEKLLVRWSRVACNKSSTTVKLKPRRYRDLNRPLHHRRRCCCCVRTEKWSSCNLHLNWPSLAKVDIHYSLGWMPNSRPRYPFRYSGSRCRPLFAIRCNRLVRLRWTDRRTDGREKDTKQIQLDFKCFHLIWASQSKLPRLSR